MSLSVKQDIRFRVYMAFTGICLFGLAIIVKAAMIQINEGPKLKALAKGSTWGRESGSDLKGWTISNFQTELFMLK